MTMYELFEQKLANLLEIDRDERKQIHEAITIVLRDCQPWIRESKGKIVYRGSSDKGEIARVPVRKDRKPLDSDEDYHGTLKAIIKKAGKSATRDNAVFVSGSLRTAKTFTRGESAQTYIVFPIGDFKYTWSTVVEDTAHVNQVHSTIAKSLRRDYDMSAYLPDFYQFNIKHFESFVSEIELYRKRAIEQAEAIIAAPSKKSSDEEMDEWASEAADRADERRLRNAKAFMELDAKSIRFGYHIISPHSHLRDVLMTMDDSWQAVFKDFDKRFRDSYYDAIASTYKGDDGTLPAAIESNHELMIECDEVYLISRQIMAAENWKYVFENNHTAESYLAQFHGQTNG